MPHFVHRAGESCDTGLTKSPKISTVLQQTSRLSGEQLGAGSLLALHPSLADEAKIRPLQQVAL